MASLADPDYRFVVPDDFVSSGVEAIPGAGAGNPKVTHDRTGVVEFVGERDGQGVVVGVLEMVEVGDLALLPGGFVFGIFGQGVGAAFDDVGYAVTEAFADCLEGSLAALVFGAVVQEGSDGHVLISPGFQDQR